jgi:hypothetical protein
MNTIDKNQEQRIRDEEHLKILSIVYYVTGAINILWALFPLLYAFMGTALLFIPAGGDEEVLKFIGSGMILISVTVSLFAFLFAAMKLYAGYCLARRKKRIFCIVAAALTTIGIPVGTTIGILTIIVLVRPSVVALFDNKQDRSVQASPNGP